MCNESQAELEQRLSTSDRSSKQLDSTWNPLRSPHNRAWTRCVFSYFPLVKDPLRVSIQLGWLLHISCFILNFTAFSYTDEGHKRSAGLHINPQWYSACDDCRSIFDLTCPYPTFTLIFILHVTAELVTEDILHRRKAPCFRASAGEDCTHFALHIAMASRLLLYQVK